MPIRILFWIFYLLGLPAMLLGEGLDTTREKQAAYQYLNHVRQAAGMIPFQTSPLLERSAGNHARYLTQNRTIGHIEQVTSPAFTGQTPQSRAAFVGYETMSVTENFSSGQTDSLDSIEGLMSAIYHRFGFLDFSKNEIGFGYSPAEVGTHFVYNMGNDRLNHFCRYAIYVKQGPYYQNICRRSHKVSSKTYDQIEATVLKQNPRVVVWPPAGATQVQPVFYEEFPDPLPHLAISGNPVSIQFNPFYFSQVKIRHFRLFREDRDEEVTPVHLMQKQNDPNQKFTALQFALFPLNRLDWGTPYRAEATFQADGKERHLQWHFTTKAVPHPMFIIPGERNHLMVSPNRTYAIFIPPVSNLPYIEQLRWESAVTLQSNVAWEDKNTILVSLSGEICKQAHFSLNGGRSFTIQLSDRDNLNPNHTYPYQAANLCQLKRLGDMAGFRIKARGERLQMKADQDYWVEIDSSDNETAQVQMKYVETMQVHVKHLSRNLIKIRLSGQTGQEATFLLENSKSFNAIIVNGT